MIRAGRNTEFGNVWVVVQLILTPMQAKNQVYKKPQHIAKLWDSVLRPAYVIHGNHYRAEFRNEVRLPFTNAIMSPQHQWTNGPTNFVLAVRERRTIWGIMGNWGGWNAWHTPKHAWPHPRVQRCSNMNMSLTWHHVRLWWGDPHWVTRFSGHLSFLATHIYFLLPLLNISLQYHIPIKLWLTPQPWTIILFLCSFRENFRMPL